MRVFLDANVLFSAAKTDGAVRQLLVLLQGRGHECCVSDHVVEEARRNLVAKGGVGLDALDRLLRQLIVAPAARGAANADVVWLPEKDRPVLVAAIGMHCGALVTGDRKHFGKGYGRSFGGVTIYSPRGLAELLEL